MRKTVEECLAISLPDLNRRGYLSGRRSGTLEWPLGDQVRIGVDLSIWLNTESAPPVGTLTITYGQANQSIRQIVELVRLPGNLGRGGIWYFICPSTARRCRTILKTERAGFVSRHAEGGLRYQSQRCSHAQRPWLKTLAQLRKKEKAVESVMWLTKPNCKRSYGGKLTRPMRRFLESSGTDCLSR